MASVASIGSATVPQRADSVATPAAWTRLRDIDGLRWLIALLMLRIDISRPTAALAVFGVAPMFFRLFHLTLSHIVYHLAAAPRARAMVSTIIAASSRSTSRYWCHFTCQPPGFCD